MAMTRGPDGATTGEKDAAGWPRDELYMVTHRSLRRVPRVRAVWEFLLERIGR